MKNISKTFLFTLFTLFILASALTASVAWFEAVSVSSTGYIYGSSEGAYFAYGNGKKAYDPEDPNTQPGDRPYGIKNTRHLNNLAWLQYMGQFNQGEHIHFELASDINVNGSTYVIPPIGTEDNPFVGVFNGNGHTVNNIKVTNDEESFSKEPTASQSFSYNQDDVEVVGFFGVVGNLEGESYSSSVNTLTDFTLKNIEVESKTENTLIGLAAGYVNADISSVKIDGNAKINVPGYTNNTTTVPSKAKEDIAEVKKLSDYGLVGYTTKSANGSGLYYKKLSEFYNSGDGTGPGGGDNWGGSINIKELNLRFYNMLNVTTDNGIASDDPSTHHPTASASASVNTVTTGKTFLSKESYHYKNSGAKNQHRYYSDDYNKLSVAIYGNGYSANTKMNNSPLNQVTLYCLEDSRTKTATHYQSSSAGSTTSYSTALPGTIIPLNVDTKANGYETVHSDDKGFNTGYIIGGQTKTSFSNGNDSTNSNAYYSATTVRTASSSIDKIEYSINSTSSFDNSKLEILTNLNKQYNTSLTKENYARIQDSYNENNTSVNSKMAAITAGRTEQREVLATDLNSYLGARKSLGNGKDGILDSATNIHGLHFLNGLVNKNSVETVDNVYINSSTPYNSYQLPRGCIDFNLKSKGYISFFAGSYQNHEKKCDGFFSLYTIKRTTTNSGSTIDNIREIDKIYNNPDVGTKVEYPYIYKIRSTNTYTTGESDISLTNEQIAKLELQFDCEYIRRKPPLEGAIYYFEIPSNKGEYVISNADNAGNTAGALEGAYLMYLDIQAAAKEPSDQLKAHYITTVRGGNSYPIGVDFIPISVSGEGGDTIAVSIASNNQGAIIFAVDSKIITVTNTDSIGEYAYKNTANCVPNPGSNQFKCTLSGEPPNVSAGGQRVLLIDFKAIDTGQTTNIRITDELNSDGTISSSNYEINIGNGFVPSSLSYISTLIASTEMNVNESISDEKSMRNLALAATLNRSSNSEVNEFTVTYNTELCDYEAKVIAIILDKNGCDLSITVESGYHVKIGSNTYDAGTSPVS